MPDYFELSYRALQAELKERGLKASGKKNELIDRLELSDENGYVNEEREEEEEEKNRGTMLFHIKTLMGSWYDIRVKDDGTIYDVKKELERKTGIEPEQMRLMENNGFNLDDNMIVADFGYDGVFLDMMVRLRPIPKSKKANDKSNKSDEDDEKEEYDRRGKVKKLKKQKPKTKT